MNRGAGVPFSGRIDLRLEGSPRRKRPDCSAGMRIGRKPPESSMSIRTIYLMVFTMLFLVLAASSW